MKHRKDVIEVIRRKLAADPDLAAAVERESFNANVAGEVYRARTNAELTQKQLADRVGTQQSVIARLEDADYDGHSLSMLKRIADALNVELRLEFRPRDAVDFESETAVSLAVESPERDYWPSTVESSFELKDSERGCNLVEAN